MFLFLSLLEFLMFLLLFGVEPVLLLLVLLIVLGVACVWRSEALVRGEFVGMRWTTRIRRPIGIRFAIGGGRLVAPSCLPCRYGAALVECSGPGSGCDGRLTVVYGGAQLLVGACFLKVLVLRPDRPDMSLTSPAPLFGRAAAANAPPAAAA